MPILNALSTLRDNCTNRTLTEVLEDIELRMARDASSLSSALDAHPRVFNAVYRGLVRSGEESGNLLDQLDSLARYLSHGAKLRGQILAAFVYPLFLILLGTAAVAILVTFVVPRFEELFASFGQDLPAATRFLIAGSDFAAQWWWAVLIGAAVLLGIVWSAMRAESTRLALHSCVLRMPVMGTLIVKLEVARIARTLSALLGSGVRITSALSVTRQAVRNIAIRNRFDGIVSQVSEGQSLATAFHKAQVFPAMMINLLRTGEQSAAISPLLDDLAQVYQEESERALNSTVKLVEPILIVLMGVAIAGIVAAVILPVFQTNTMVS